MKQWALILAVAALALAAITAGCGESESEGSDTVSKAEYVKRADAICLKLNKDTSAKYGALNQRGRPLTAAEQREATKSVYLANLQKRLDELQQLPMPEGQEEKVSALYAALQEGIRNATAQKAIAFTNTYGFFAKANKLAKELGFEYCYEV